MQHDGWRLGYLAREATRNVLGRGSRLLPLLALAILAGVGSSSFIAYETVRLRDEIAQLDVQGQYVLVYRSTSTSAPAQISRASCESLAGQDGVRHAGLLTPVSDMDLLPVGVGLPAQRASTTLVPELSRVDVLIGPVLAGSGAASADRSASAFRVKTGTSETATAVVPTARPEALATDFSVTLPLLPADVDGPQCVVVLRALSDPARAGDLHGAALAVEGNPVTATRPFIATNDPVDTYLHRPGRWLPLLLALVGALATGIASRLRASEMAVYRLSGTSRTSVLTLLALETLLIAGTAGLCAVAAALALRDRYLDPLIPVTWGLAMAGVWAVGGLLATTDLALRRPTNLAKDR
ncbi:hypothetical protein [Motilibacter deserti]|uniref:FtsX-like permease family protein n=1 Tax=Motilibacter deserti TaxID=2714956 RepID=A0ABX0GVH7_9ACTN|nr:hypothetical protein [Motilibacter deserti]NHC14513.1 hypothetical protein [Motilibacter deserti]